MNASARATIDIRGFIANSLVEWEGRIAAVVFTGGCNWRCAYCHGWRFVLEPEALSPVDPETVFARLAEQEGWVDGIAVTGGEPTLQPGLADFLREARDAGLAVKLETNGTRPAVIAALLEEGLVDCLALDYKAPPDGRLAKVTRVSEAATAADRVRESFRLAAASGLEREYHTTLCPAFVDAALLDEMGGSLEPGGLWVLQQYELEERLDPAAAGAARYDAAALEELAAVARRHHERVLLRKGRGV